MAGLTREAEKISNLVRSASVSDSRSNHTPTPTQQWDSQSGARPNSYESNQRQAPSNGRESAARGSIRDSREQAPSERYGPSTRHTRSDSEATGIASSVGYSETTQSGPPGRRHDWDVQTVETTSGFHGLDIPVVPSPWRTALCGLRVAYRRGNASCFAVAARMPSRRAISL